MRHRLTKKKKEKKKKEKEKRKTNGLLPSVAALIAPDGAESNFGK